MVCSSRPVALAGIDNTAAATATYAGAPVSSTSASSDVPVIIAQPAMAVTKTPSVTAGAVPGQVITYTYVVTNTGNQTLSNVVLSEAHNASGPVPTPANETLSADTGVSGDSTDTAVNDGVWSVLAPGDSVTFTATYTVTQSDVDLLQ